MYLSNKTKGKFDRNEIQQFFAHFAHFSKLLHADQKATSHIAPPAGWGCALRMSRPGRGT